MPPAVGKARLPWEADGRGHQSDAGIAYESSSPQRGRRHSLDHQRTARPPATADGAHQTRRRSVELHISDRRAASNATGYRPKQQPGEGHKVAPGHADASVRLGRCVVPDPRTHLQGMGGFHTSVGEKIELADMYNSLSNPGSGPSGPLGIPGYTAGNDRVEDVVGSYLYTSENKPSTPLRDLSSFSSATNRLHAQPSPPAEGNYIKDLRFNNLREGCGHHSTDAPRRGVRSSFDLHQGHLKDAHGLAWQQHHKDDSHLQSKPLGGVEGYSPPEDRSLLRRSLKSGLSSDIRTRSEGGLLTGASSRQNVLPSLQSMASGMNIQQKQPRLSADEPPKPRSQQEAEAAQTVLPGPVASIYKNVFEIWMALHSKVEERDQKRKAKHFGQVYIPSHGKRGGQLTYSKDHTLIEEAYTKAHADMGSIVDSVYLKQHLGLFEEAFQRVYSMLEGHIQWEALQFFGYAYHHAFLLASLANNSYGSAIRKVEEEVQAKKDAEAAREATKKELERSKSHLQGTIDDLEAEMKELRQEVADLKDAKKAYEATRAAVNSELGSSNPIAKLEALQRQYTQLKNECDRINRENHTLNQDMAELNKTIHTLKADLGREHELVQLVEDTLPANSDRISQRLTGLSDKLTKDQMKLVLHAVSVGNDPLELYNLMMLRSNQSEDLHPHLHLMGELRETFQSVHITSTLGHTFATGDVCAMEDRPLTKAYLIALLRNNDVKEMKKRLGESLVQRISIAYNRGLDLNTLVNLLDGRLSKKGTCMITYRKLLGVLREHMDYQVDGPVVQDLMAAGEACSLTSMIDLRSKNHELEKLVSSLQKEVEVLEGKVRVRDFKFGKVIGTVDSNDKKDRADGTGTMANTWALTSITKLDEFLARDWTGDFQALGTGSEVPKFLRAEGPIRNISMGKKFTEELISDIWESKESYDTQNKRHVVSLTEYVAGFLEKRFGKDAVMNGYNLLHSCHKYKYDPDCEVFLQVLDGRVSQDIYHEFMVTLEALMGYLHMLDHELHPAGARGTLHEKEIKAMIQCFFSDKSNSSIQDLIHALHGDVTSHGGNPEEVDYLNLFAEDDNANQGEFATLLKRQHLQERMKFLYDLQTELINCSKKDNVTELNSRQVEKVVRQVMPHLSKENIDGLLELGLGAAWKTGVTENVMGIMKGIRRGRPGFTRNRQSNKEVMDILNTARESLGLFPKEERQILSKTRERVAKMANVAGICFQKDSNSLNTLMGRSLKSMRLVVEKIMDENGDVTNLPERSEKSNTSTVSSLGGASSHNPMGSMRSMGSKELGRLIPGRSKKRLP